MKAYLLTRQPQWALFTIASTLLLTLGAGLWVNNSAHAAHPQVFKLKANYKEHYTLPFELQGHWHRTRFIQKSSSNNLFKAIEEGDWDIRQVDNMVALTNPATGVRAMATITNIQAGIVTLTYDKHIDGKRWCRETLDLKPKGSQLTGEQRKECYKTGLDTPYFYAMAYVTGNKAPLTYSSTYSYLMLSKPE